MKNLYYMIKIFSGKVLMTPDIKGIPANIISYGHSAIILLL